MSRLGLTRRIDLQVNSTTDSFHAVRCKHCSTGFRLGRDRDRSLAQCPSCNGLTPIDDEGMMPLARKLEFVVTLAFVGAITIGLLSIVVAVLG